MASKTERRVAAVCRWYPKGETTDDNPFEIPAAAAREIAHLAPEVRAWDEACVDAENSGYFQLAEGRPWAHVDPPPFPHFSQCLAHFVNANYDELAPQWHRMLKHVYSKDRIGAMMETRSALWEHLRG